MAGLEPKQNQIRYQRVRGLRRTLTLNRAALFTADDHLLVCDYRSGFTERYRRFYFRDIEAIILRKTTNWLFGLMVWFVIGILFLGIASAATWNWRVTLTIEGICALFFAFGLIRGPSCRAHIQTAVQTDTLPMFKRVRKTRRILSRTLFPLIEQAQGKSESGQVVPPQSPAFPLSSTPAAAEPKPAPISSVIAPPIVQRPLSVGHKLSWFHFGTFVFAFITGLNAIWEVNSPSAFSFRTCVTLFCLSIFGGIGSLIWQGKQRVHVGAVTMIWFLIITFMMGGAIIEYVYSVTNYVTLVGTPGHGSSPPPAFSFINPFQLRPMPGFDRVLWSYGIWSVLLGLAGLIFVFIPPPAKAQPPPLPAKHPTS